MPSTQDYESLLDLPNVQAVDYDAEADCVQTFVTEKKPEADLANTDLVAENVDRDSDVIEVGDLSPQTFPEPQGDRHTKHRPVKAGVSEINANSTAATAGPYPARVVDTSKGEWSDAVSTGDLVRLSNNHVYARINKATFGEPILQPSPYDGGEESDKVGELAGYVPIEEGVTVDLAARTVTKTDEADAPHELDSSWPTSIRRDNYAALKGEALVKTGRTTGVTEADVKATSASVRINYGKKLGKITVRDQLITEKLSEGGDSGSPVYRKQDGALVGELFAGSPKVTIIYKASNIEETFGVELLAQSGDTPPYEVSLDTEVSITMEETNLDVTALTGDKPVAGEQFTATATVEGNYPGTFYIEAQDKLRKYEFTAAHKQDADKYKRTVDIVLTAPENADESFSVALTGGYAR